MDYATNLSLFFVLLFGIIVVPGLDMLFVVANTLTGGRRVGMAATAGIAVGGMGHTLWGAFGAGLIALWLPSAFTALVLLGGAYMIWIGWTLLRSRIVLTASGLAGGGRDAARAFRQGALTCLLNPKAYVFILAVYPQFVQPRFGPIWMQALVLGAMSAATQVAVYGGLALAAARARDTLVNDPARTVWAGRAAGALIIAVALVTLWQGLRPLP